MISNLIFFLIILDCDMTEWPCYGHKTKWSDARNGTDKDNTVYRTVPNLTKTIEAVLHTLQSYHTILVHNIPYSTILHDTKLGRRMKQTRISLPCSLDSVSSQSERTSEVEWAPRWPGSRRAKYKITEIEISTTRWLRTHHKI